jgi:hypothetical protein
MAIMTSVKSKLTTSVQAAKSQIGTKSAPDGAPEPQAKPKAANREPKPPVAAPAAKNVTKPKAGHRLDAVLEPTGAPAASAGELFPARVWPD